MNKEQELTKQIDELKKIIRNMTHFKIPNDRITNIDVLEAELKGIQHQKAKEKEFIEDLTMQIKIRIREMEEYKGGTEIAIIEELEDLDDTIKELAKELLE
jgi:hypothetical protein